MRFDFVTVFPRMFDALVGEGIIARAAKQNLIEMQVWDLRDFASDRHRSTDDEAYGGGPGMVMLAEPVLRCVDKIREQVRGSREEAGAERGKAFHLPSNLEPHIVLTSPQGRPFTQNVAKELASKSWVLFLCGRYEGFDHRVHEALQPDEISIGDFVVTGGELPAMVMADAVGRMIEGVVGNSASVEQDSFFHGLLDYPHYTRPEELRGLRVPDVLLSGNHEKIRRWRRQQALRQTRAHRPDLLETAELDDEGKGILAELENETGR